jgi:hypothetical protein
MILNLQVMKFSFLSCFPDKGSEEGSLPIFSLPRGCANLVDHRMFLFFCPVNDTRSPLHLTRLSPVVWSRPHGGDIGKWTTFDAHILVSSTSYVGSWQWLGTRLTQSTTPATNKCNKLESSTTNWWWDSSCTINFCKAFFTICVVTFFICSVVLLLYL